MKKRGGPVTPLRDRDNSKKKNLSQEKKIDKKIKEEPFWMIQAGKYKTASSDERDLMIDRCEKEIATGLLYQFPKNTKEQQYIRKRLCFGINEVTKALEQNLIQFFFISRDNKTTRLFSHLPTLAKQTNTPYLVFPKASKQLGNIFHCKQMCAFGIKKKKEESELLSLNNNDNQKSNNNNNNNRNKNKNDSGNKNENDIVVDKIVDVDVDDDNNNNNNISKLSNEEENIERKNNQEFDEFEQKLSSFIMFVSDNSNFINK